MFCTILLELLLPFKKTANIQWTKISAQTLHDSKTKWQVPPERKNGAAAKLKQTGYSFMLRLRQIDLLFHIIVIECPFSCIPCIPMYTLYTGYTRVSER